MFAFVPFLAIVVIAYNVVVLLTGPSLATTVAGTRLPSGADWALSVGDLLILIGVGLLFLEILKASRAGRTSGLDHALSMGLFVVVLLEFLLVPACATGTFLIITALTLIDVIAGFTVSLSTARRDISIS